MLRLGIDFLKSGITATFGIGILTSSAQALTLTPTNNGVDFVRTILGSGINIPSNLVRYQGNSNASGIFTDGLSSGLGIESGIILTTGNAINAIGPNLGDSTGTNHNLRLTGTQLRDPVLLDFEFESEGGNVFFNYVFASEEYNESVNASGFGDTFRIFIDGENVALIPGTNIPVDVQTVNTNNPQFFNNNAFSSSGSPFNIAYDGFTDVFTAQALNLAPGSHSIRFAIADTGDGFIDSAIFIQAGSFSDRASNQKVPESSTLISLLAFGAVGVYSRRLFQSTSAKSNNN